MLFIPGEAFLAPALEHDPALLEHAMARKVHIATPTTLVTMLRTAQYAWQQAALSENARAVFDLGRELYDRLTGLGRHVDGLGKALTNAVSTLQPDGRLAGEPGAGQRAQAEPAGRGRRRAGAADGRSRKPSAPLSAPDLITDPAPELVPQRDRSAAQIACAAAAARAPVDGRGGLITRDGGQRICRGRTGGPRLPQHSMARTR